MGAGIIAVDKKTGRILLGRRGLAGNEPNTWTPFGGTFDDKDNVPKTTAIREFREETGCKCGFQISKKPIYVFDTNHLRFYTYLGVFENQFPVKINSENVDYDWFEIDRLPENLHPGFKELLDKNLKKIKFFI